MRVEASLANLSSNSFYVSGGSLRQHSTATSGIVGVNLGYINPNGQLMVWMSNAGEMSANTSVKLYGFIEYFFEN